MPRKAKPDTPDLEQSLTELEKIVAKMEKGEQTLEQSLDDFERGMILAQNCQDSLNNAELRMKKLVKKNQGLEYQDFTEDDL